MDWLQFLNESFLILFRISFDTMAFWAPVFLGFIFWKVWLRYIQADYISKMRWVMLEISFPKEIYKPLQAMEIVLSALDQKRDGSHYERWWKGLIRPWFSLEIVSIEGTIKFFIRTQDFYRDLIESRIYSQYPEIELRESPDYSQFYKVPKKGWVTLFGMEFELLKPDPIPIKTYIDYGMDKPFLDEKQRLDPMTPMLEFLGSIGGGEQIWIQILVQAHRGRYKKEDGSIGDWRDEAKAEIKKIMGGEKKEENNNDLGSMPFFRLTKTQTENIAAIERNMSKVGFDCGIRIIYLTNPGKFRIQNIPGLAGSFRQFNSAELNGFKPVRAVGFDVPWEDIDKFLGIHRLGRIRRKFVDAYRRRSYFYPPYQRKPFVLTTEELATIFHIPSAIAETPTLKRIGSKKTEPPINLPI